MSNGGEKHIFSTPLCNYETIFQKSSIDLEVYWYFVKVLIFYAFINFKTIILAFKKYLKYKHIEVIFQCWSDEQNNELKVLYSSQNLILEEVNSVTATIGF